MNEITPSLMTLIDGDDFFERVLVVESSAYLEPLKARFPNAEIFFVTNEPDDVEKYSCHAKTFLVDYRLEKLPFDKNFFDAIIGDLTLEVVNIPQDIAAGFSTYLKSTGVWLTSFRNLRHWKVLEKLMQGSYNGIVSRMYTRRDFERLLTASFYKSMTFLPIIKKSPPKFLSKLLECGFENFSGDLEAEFWLVRAALSTPEIALLKSLYTPEIRAELSRLLHRIEYDVDTENSVKRLAELCATEGIFDKYVEDFVNEVVFHKKNFYANVEKYFA